MEENKMKKVFLGVLILMLLSSSLFADKRLQDYPAIGDGFAVDADLLRIEDMGASAGSRTKKILLSSLISYIFGANRTMSGTFSMGTNEISGSNVTFTGGNITGMTILDGDRLDVDNLRIDGNDFVSTDTNGNIIIDPNGTGDIYLTTSGGYVIIPAGDLKIGAVAIVATGTHINYITGAESQVAGLTENHAANPISVTGITTTLSAGGLINFNTTSNAITATLPRISADKSQEYLCIFGTDGANDVTIVDDAGDGGFVKADGTTTGTSITLDDEGDFVFLKSSAYATGKWMIIGGSGYTLN